MITEQDILDFVDNSLGLGEEMADSILLAVGLDDAFIGLTADSLTAVYSYEKVLTILMERDGMDREGAIEFFDFNIGGAYVGPCGAIFMHEYERRAPRV